MPVYCIEYIFTTNIMFYAKGTLRFRNKIKSLLITSITLEHKRSYDILIV